MKRIEKVTITERILVFAGADTRGRRPVGVRELATRYVLHPTKGWRKVGRFERYVSKRDGQRSGWIPRRGLQVLMS